MTPPIAEISDERLRLRLIHVEIGRTYGGLLEGLPSKRFNDRKIQRLVEGARSSPVHLVEPPRLALGHLRGSSETYGPDTFLGPLEELPPVHCAGLFEGPMTSKVTAPDFDHWLTELTIVWFQQPSTALIHPDLVPQLLAVPWDALARDVSFSDM